MGLGPFQPGIPARSFSPARYTVERHPLWAEQSRRRGGGDAYPECVGEDARQAARNRVTEMYVERFGNVISEKKGAELIRELLDIPRQGRSCCKPSRHRPAGHRLTTEGHREPGAGQHSWRTNDGRVAWAGVQEFRLDPASCITQLARVSPLLLAGQHSPHALSVWAWGLVCLRWGP